MNASHFELRFRSLFRSGRALSFPCDAQGAVQLDDLSDKARENYFFARTVVGRDYASPVVCAADETSAVLHS
ncbi:hypothetical protein ACG04R_11450 [Roseateles sp. BYS78W]|uniref:Uncharacterized protein n=1 Tax=Pelomonas candidula TaxID=3299025 RepID=A0ABW7HBU1_9BURK